MAKITKVTLVDDLDRSTPADETISFALDGISYSIDLSAANAERLRNSFAEWIGHADRVGGRKQSRSAAKGARDDLNSVRTWARDNGHAVKDRGRIPASVMEAYRRANG